MRCPLLPFPSQTLPLQGDINRTAIHGLRHTYGEGRVLYFAQGHDMAQIKTRAFEEVLFRCVLWLAKRL
jgi:type 1 glutamine amidotransferase